MAGSLSVRTHAFAAVLALLGPLGPAPAEERRDLSPDDKAALAAAEREMRQQHEEAVKEALDAFKKAFRAAKSVGDRVKAVQTLGATERDAKIAAELGRLTGDAESVRIAAMEALAKYRKDAAAAQALLRMIPLHARTASMLAKNLEALGGVGHDTVIPVLARHVEEKETRVAAAAIRALGAAGAAPAIPLLVDSWERLEKEKTRGDDQKRAAEERLKDLEPAYKDALAALTGKTYGNVPDWRTWWAENRATFKPKEEPPPPLCRHFLPIHVAGGVVTGGILREVWTGVGGVHVNDAVAAFDRPPSASVVLTRFEAPVDCGNDYAARVRGFVVPPVDGDYVFWISSDDASALFLSPDADPAHKKWVAGVPDWTGVQEWTKHGSQKSKPVPLVAGRKYYIEAQHKEGAGDKDHLVVAWEIPGGTREVIDGRYLAPPDGAEVARAVPKPATGAAPAEAKAPSTAPPPAAAPDAGWIAREVWWDVRGGLPEMRAGHRFDEPPDRVTRLDGFEAPRDEADRYVSRIRGYLIPAATGDHRFWIASDNESELWLSLHEDPSTKRRIAGVLGGGGGNHTSPRGWSEKPGQQSEPVSLVAGRRYYIEAVHAEGEGNDHLAVAWQTPGSAGPEVIPGRCLAPYRPPDAVAPPLSPPAKPPGTFLRAVNLGGPAVSIDGRPWESGTEAENCLVFGRLHEDAASPLRPADAVSEPVLRTAVGGGDAARVVLAGLPAGACDVYVTLRAYDAEERVAVEVNGRASEPAILPAGTWRRIGPCAADTAGGFVSIRCRGGRALLCGVELWRR